MFKPLLEFRPKTIFSAFIINALLIAIINVLTIEVRSNIDKNEYTKEFPIYPHKIFFTTLASFFIALFTYISVRLLFGTGGGMLGPEKTYKNFL